MSLHWLLSNPLRYSVGNTHRKLLKGVLTEYESVNGTNYFTILYGPAKIKFLLYCAFNAL